MDRIADSRRAGTLCRLKCMILFCLPMCYSFWTRYKGKNGVFAWLVKYLVPVSVLGVAHTSYDVVQFLVGLLYVYSLYEIGYIQNDCETIKNEANPTMRLTESDLALYEKHRSLIYVFRAAQILLWGALLLGCGVNPWIVAYGFITLPVFLLYNTVRNKASLFVHLLLLFFRYSVPVVAGINGFCPLCIGYMLLLYPLTLFVERSVKGKFGYRNNFFVKYVMHDYSERYGFRVKYYSIFLVISIVCTACQLLPYVYLLPVILLLLTSIISKNHESLHYEK